MRVGHELRRLAHDDAATAMTDEHHGSVWRSTMSATNRAHEASVT